MIADGRLTGTPPDAVERGQRWCDQDTVRATVTTDPVLSHADLTVDQVFITDDGYRVIDWQRPIRGPGGLDVVSLLVGRRIDSRPYVLPRHIELFWFLRLYWAVEAQHEPLPERRRPLFEQWAG